MRVLLTGGAGFIGSHALVYFFQKHPTWQFVVVDSLNYAASPDRLPRHKPSADDDHFRFLVHDLAVPFNDRLRERIGKIDYVMHFAAETHVDRSMVEPEPFFRSNALGTFNLLEYVRRYQPGLKMFFHISTDETYGAAPVGTDHTEEAPHRPSNPYSATKAAAEDLCFAWNHSMGVPVIVTNTMNNIGEMQHREKYVPKVIRSILAKEVIPVHGSPDSPGSRKYIYVRDHADAIDFLIVNGRRGEKYNVVGREEVDNLQIVRRIEKLLGMEAKIRFVDFHSTRPGHDARYSLDGGKMAKLGWTPPTSMDAALEKIIGWSLANPDWM